MIANLSHKLESQTKIDNYTLEAVNHAPREQLQYWFYFQSSLMMVIYGRKTFIVQATSHACTWTRFQILPMPPVEKNFKKMQKPVTTVLLGHNQCGVGSRVGGLEHVIYVGIQV